MKAAMRKPARVVWRVSVETRHFSFEAFADSEGEARAALSDAFNVHRMQYHLPMNWHEDLEVEAQAFELGKGYRDRTAL